VWPNTTRPRQPPRRSIAPNRELPMLIVARG
jgi:hypothetical protein